MAIAIDAGVGMQVIPTLRDPFVRAAFGDAAEDFKSLVDMIKRSLETSGCDAQSVGDWERPFDGVFIGEFASAIGSSIEDIADSASSVASSFYRPTRQPNAHQDASDHKSRVLEGQVRSSIIGLYPRSRAFFGRLIPGYSDRHDRRLGFFDDFYAVQFGVLTSGSVGTCRAFAQAKLWNLERLRDTPRLFNDALELEFIAQQTSSASASRNAAIELREQLAEDAAQAEISFVSVADARSAARRVLEHSVLESA
ncbi:MAG: hypothetical protein RLO46_13115 [Pseudomonadales bacterium]